MPTPTEIVDLQLKYYNARDLTGFLSTYHADAVLYRLGMPEPWAVGHAGLTPIYTNMFAKVGLKANIVKRMVLGNFVVDEENVTWDAQAEALHAIAVYEVQNNKITRVWMIK